MHIMVPIRPLQEDGTWGQKQKKVPVLTPDGQPVLNRKGQPVFRAVHTTDWSRKETLEELRSAWAKMCNELYEEKGLTERVDARSYEERGIDKIPMVHEGPNVQAMEARGISTALGSLNRLIRALNDMKERAKNLLQWSLFRESQLMERMVFLHQPTLADYLRNYCDKRKILYSWRLTEADKMPEGKRADLSLREKERKVQSLQMQGITGSNITVLELVERYLSLKTGVKHNTLANYKFVVNVLKKEEFAYKKVDDVKLSDAKIFLIKLQRDGRGYSSIHSIRGVLRPAFQMAVDDDLILKNPFGFELGTVLVNDSQKRHAVSPEDEAKFLEFVKNDPHYNQYYDAFYILFKTGLRISEFCGLTVKDLDFKEDIINVNHQLQRTREMKYIIVSTKTTSGTRLLPMEADVKEAFLRILKNRRKPKREPMVDGYGGFLFLDKNGRPMVALHWEKYMQHAREKYNRENLLQLPPVTPHICRHTYCTNMANSGMNPKTLQYLMGHSDVSVTLNIYTHTGYDDAKKELARLKEARDELEKKKFITQKHAQTTHVSLIS